MNYRIINETNIIKCLPAGRGEACNYRKQEFSSIRYRSTQQKHQIKYLQRWLNYFFTHEKYPIVMKKNEPWSKHNEPLNFGQ